MKLYSNLYNLGDTLKIDDHRVLELIKDNILWFWAISRDRHTYEFCLSAVKVKGRVLHFVPEEHQSPEMIIAAIKNDINAKYYIKVPLTPDMEQFIEDETIIQSI